MYKINRERLTDTFIDLAKIPSPSWHEGRVNEYIIKRLEKLGARVKKHRCQNSYNLLAVIDGNPKKNTILLSAHTDTVIPCSKINPIVKNGKIFSDGTSVLGSDDKAAIAAIIEALHHIKENRIDHGPIEILFTCAEEVGLEGIKCFQMKALKSRMAFVFDSGGSVGKIIVKAPYHETIKLDIKGRAAHAGMEPEKGVNAISVLSKIIAGLPSGRIDEETTMNVGTISGGMATNIVAEDASCALEIRSINRVKLIKYEKLVKETAKKIAAAGKAKIAIKSSIEYSGFRICKEDKIVYIAEKALKRIGIKPVISHSGGGSDTNVFNINGIKAINLSCGMQKIHSRNEFIAIDDLVKTSRLILSIIETV